ncbi:MAG: SpoIIE family protein phosphatase [Melioribacteraceae bacterium]|nr:serine/threonine protein phosphatase [Ignavibacteriota bacterium]MBZ0183433.1 SpoIIE family protein phosphatase [Melioribacteraceae bacterium]
MEQKKIYRTIETVTSKYFETDKDLFKEVINQLVDNEQIDVTGARIWRFDEDEMSYKLMLQNGNVQKIENGFPLKISDYPIFELISKERTILADETDKVLISKGIFKYSASGVGRKIKIKGKYFYQYLLAVNSSNIDDELRYTLNIVATILTSKLKERRIYDQRKNLIEDLDKAKQLLKSIIPEHEYEFHNYDLFGVTIPAEIVGGDFFDYLKIGEDEDRLGIVVGDAASKGLAAAAEAMYISGAVRMAANFQIKISPLMRMTNQLINKIFADDKFTSLFYCELSDDKKGLSLYANAGHNPPIFISSETKKITRLNPTGPLLGPAPNSRFETDSINFKNGDVLVIYTDGIVEAANSKFEFYEEERLEKVISNNFHKTPKEIALTILDDVNQFSTSRPKYQDDKTLVIIKRNNK